MADELPILKGILKGNFSYHNARKCKQYLQVKKKIIILVFFSKPFQSIIKPKNLFNHSSLSSICLAISKENIIIWKQLAINDCFNLKRKKKQHRIFKVDYGFWIYGSWTPIVFMLVCNEK